MAGDILTHARQSEGWEKNYFILACDDNHVNRKIHKLYLEDFGFHFEIVESGTRCIEEFKRGLYDLIILDIGLPDINGVDVIKQIRAHEKNHNLIPRPILVDSAHDHAKEALAAGANAFVQKPCMNWKERHKLLKELLKVQ